jgi:hypothetical protein
VNHEALERVRAFAGCAADHPLYFARLRENADAWLAMPAMMGRLEVLRLPCGGVVAFTWCYSDGNLLNPPRYEDWARAEGRAVWVSDMVASAGVGGVRAARAVVDALLDLALIEDGQVVHCWLNASGRYGRVTARKRKGSAGGGSEVLFPKCTPGGGEGGVSVQAQDKHHDAGQRPLRHHAAMDEGQPAEG